MRASFERSELLHLLGPVTKVVESRNTIPVLANILLSVTADGTVSVTGTDLDIRVTATGKAEVADAGATTVDAKRLEDIVRKLPAGAEISIVQEANALIVKSGRSRFKLPTLAATDFPDISAGAFDVTFDVELQALFKPVGFAISTEETRFYLNGIYLHVADDKLRAVATDGHRLAQHDTALDPAAVGMPGVIVPRKAVGHVPAGVIALSVSAAKVRFSTPGLEIVSKVVDGSFPDYQLVIPHRNDKIAIVGRAALFAAADRVSSIANERGRSVKLSFADGALALSARSETGEASDELEVTYDSEPLEIGFNSNYLRDVLGVFGEETVQVRLNDPVSPALITAGGPLLAVLMPMRV